MINQIKKVINSIFSKEEVKHEKRFNLTKTKTEQMTCPAKNCLTCKLKECGEFLELGKVLPEKVTLPKDFVMGNDTCLILDDSYGQSVVLLDDVEAVFEEKGIKGINILMLHNNMCAFEINDLLNEYGKELKIKYAIIDITIGGSQRIGERIVKLTGVDVVGFLKRHYEDVKIIIYTGNNLNRYIEANALIASKFKKIMKQEIEDNLIIKRSLSIEERRRQIFLRLFQTN